MCVCVRVYSYCVVQHVYIYIHGYIFMYVCVYTYIYILIYANKHTNSHCVAQLAFSFQQYKPCNTLQHTLQHTATHCNTLQHTATHGNTDTHILLRNPLPFFNNKKPFLKNTFSVLNAHIIVWCHSLSLTNENIFFLASLLPITCDIPNPQDCVDQSE